MNGVEAEDKVTLGVVWCCRGDDSGEPLDSDERSEEDELMD